MKKNEKKAVLLSMRGLAEELGFSPATVLRLERRGVLTAETRIGRLVRYDLEKCRKALAKVKETPRPESPLMVPCY